MEQKTFNKWYRVAETVEIMTDIGFNRAAYFWLDLTEKQLKKMVALMIAQGADIKQADIEGWNKMIQLKNGNKIKVD